MKTRSDRRLLLKPYLQAIEGIHTQFELIRLGLKYLPKKRIKAFFEERERYELAQLEAGLSEVKDSVLALSCPPDKRTELESILNESNKRIIGGKKREHRKHILKDTNARREVTEDALNRSELLLLVAHFETFMKLVHTTFLEAAGQVVFGRGFRERKDAQILIREIFDGKSSYWDSNKFLRELSIKEAKWLDQQKIEIRGKYFLRHFGVSFGDNSEVQELAKIMDTRNRISHDLYAPPPRELAELKEERPFVSRNMIKTALSFFTRIPEKCCQVGSKKYPGFFST